METKDRAAAKLVLNAPDLAIAHRHAGPPGVLPTFLITPQQVEVGYTLAFCAALRHEE